MTELLWICGGLLAVEAGLVAVVRRLRRGFQWLVTEADEMPSVDAQALAKFFRTSFDPELGWTRRPGDHGKERGANGEISWHIDATGSRSRALPGAPEEISVFGDSYAFCRQVEDQETWEAELSRTLGVGVGNYGVGNYGVDQALLRYERAQLPHTVRVAVLAFVPESICRVQSRWKHYLEFGNTFAFKPRFVVDPAAPDGLRLLPCPVRGPEDFAALPRLLPDIQAGDGFYRRKFRAVQFRRPYVLSLLRNPARNASLLALLAVRAAARLAGRSSPRLEDAPFAAVMRWNLRDAHRMYGELEARQLLGAILQRFARGARARGHAPLVLVLPQLMDLLAPREQTRQWQKFFQEQGEALPVLDLTETLRKGDLSENFVNDSYGGHLSARGNALVAELVAEWARSQAAPESNA